MSSRSLVLSLALLVVTGAAPAAASEATKPLRTLVYDVVYSARTSHEKKTSGFNGAYGGGNAAVPSVASGSGSMTNYLRGDDSGKLQVDVVAATPDGGLVVDAAFAGKANSHSATRVAIYPDGRLSFDPKNELSPETMRVLPLLARGLIAGRDVSPGSTWSTQALPPARGSATYRIDHVDGQMATMSIQTSIVLAGPMGFDRQDNATAIYACDLLSPVTYDVIERIRRQLDVDETETTNAHLTAKLVSDTFAKR